MHLPNTVLRDIRITHLPVLLGLLLTAGCFRNSGDMTRAPVRAETPLPENAPPDFTLAVTVFVPDGANWGAYSQPFTPARYILEPNGSLRVGIGAGVSEQMYPPVTREVARSSVHDVWADTTRCGVAGSGTRRKAAPQSVAQPTAHISIRWDDRWDEGVIVLTDQNAKADAARTLISRLGALAWMQ